MDRSNKSAKYVKFLTMIATSTVAMLALMYLNSFDLSHVWFSETRTYMAIYMGSIMAVIMLGFMWTMYEDPIFNWSILGGAFVFFAISVFLVRSQTTVQDTSWMKAMIPHHSIAILTSSRAEIDDIRVKQLAEEIISAQEREIAEMEWLIEDIKKNGKASTEANAAARPVPNF